VWFSVFSDDNRTVYFTLVQTRVSLVPIRLGIEIEICCFYKRLVTHLSI